MKVTKNNFEEEVLKSEKTVLVDLYADWCGPCRMLAPILEEVETEREDVKVCKINVDDSQDIAARFGQALARLALRRLVLIKDGKTVASSTGYKTKEQVLAFIDGQ